MINPDKIRHFPPHKTTTATKGFTTEAGEKSSQEMRRGGRGRTYFVAVLWPKEKLLGHKRFRFYAAQNVYTRSAGGNGDSKAAVWARLICFSARFRVGKICRSMV